MRSYYPLLSIIMLKIQLLSLLFTLCMLCLPVQATLYTIYIASYVHISPTDHMLFSLYTLIQ